MNFALGAGLHDLVAATAAVKAGQAATNCEPAREHASWRCTRARRQLGVQERREGTAVGGLGGLESPSQALGHDDRMVASNSRKGRKDGAAHPGSLDRLVRYALGFVHDG